MTSEDIEESRDFESILKSEKLLTRLGELALAVWSWDLL